ILQPQDPLAAHGTAAVDLDVYVGPKDHKLFISNPTYAARGYDAILDATGASCALLTFHWLTGIMRWLLDILHHIPPHNYGLSIIMLVLIVRLALHGLSKRNQIRMMRMQKKMAVLQPKMEALRARLANEPAELNREMMQLYRSEGVS